MIEQEDKEEERRKKVVGVNMEKIMKQKQEKIIGERKEESKFQGLEGSEREKNAKSKCLT